LFEKLKLIENFTKKKETNIVFVGAKKAGKSSTMNALLELKTDVTRYRCLHIVRQP